MSDPITFVPHSGKHGVPRASRKVVWLDIRDNSMPERDWSAYDAPARDRFKSERAPRVPAVSVPDMPVPSFLRRQA